MSALYPYPPFFAPPPFSHPIIIVSLIHRAVGGLAFCCRFIRLPTWFFLLKICFLSVRHFLCEEWTFSFLFQWFNKTTWHHYESDTSKILVIHSYHCRRSSNNHTQSLIIVTSFSLQWPPSSPSPSSLSKYSTWIYTGETQIWLCLLEMILNDHYRMNDTSPKQPWLLLILWCDMNIITNLTIAHLTFPEPDFTTPPSSLWVLKKRERHRYLFVGLQLPPSSCIFFR